MEQEKYYKVDNKYILRGLKRAEQFRNLITTYNFDRSQKEVIVEGLNEDLNVSYYAKPEYN